MNALEKFEGKKIFTYEEIIDDQFILQGELFKVIGVPMDEEVGTLGTIVVVTSDEKHPLYCIDTQDVWATETTEDYKFERRTDLYLVVLTRP